eukprot:scaffold143902_cov15-Tisochrysis_lutea.AAC.3
MQEQDLSVKSRPGAGGRHVGIGSNMRFKLRQQACISNHLLNAHLVKARGMKASIEEIAT